MLSAFSKFAKSTAGKVLTSIMAVGLLSFGMANVITSLGTNTVASSAGIDLSTRDFSRGYQDYLRLISQQIGRQPTAEEALAFQVPQRVVQQFHTDAAVNKLSLELGVGVSDARLAQVISTDPTLVGMVGTVNKESLKTAVRQLGYTENEYMDLKARSVRREQIESALFDDAPVPETARDLIKRFATDKRTIDYFVLNAASLPPVAEPTEDQLAAYLSEHQSEYRTVETRQTDVMALSPEVLALGKTPTEEEISAEYDRTKDSRSTSEKRTIGQIALTSAEQATAFTEGAAAGKPLADLLSETGLTVNELGTLTRAQINDSQLADAAFSLPEGGYIVIDGVGGNKRVITVSAVTPGGTVSLADAHDEISWKLALAAARSEYNDILDQIEELRAVFKPLPEIAARFNLPVYPVALTADGSELSVVTGMPPEDRAKVASRVFSTDQGDLAPMVSLGANYSVWFDLKSVDPARDQTLDEVRDKVSAAWTKQQEDEAVAAAVKDILDKINSGTSFADAAVAANQFPQLSEPLSRSGNGGVIDGTVASAVFEGSVGHTGSAVNGADDHVVFQVVDVVPSEDPAPATATQFVEQGTRNSLYTAFVTGVTSEVGLRVNQDVLARVVGTDTAAQ